MRIPSDRLATKALLALEEAAAAAEHSPLQPSLAVRFALAYLYAIGAGDRGPYDLFWDAVRKRGEEYNDCILRFSMARAALEAIYRDVGHPRSREMMFYQVSRNRAHED
jgi:hypothetical protein